MSGDHFLNLQPGTIVNGRYEVVKCLGTGSMGMVYACRHRELAGHIVAMKVLFAEVARDEVAAARFRNEIVASYGVSHPNVVRAYEYFRDGDLIAFTMEYIGGGDLADRISEDELLTPWEIVNMLLQMCSGVQAIHDAGIIHRDLKPENILISAQSQIKITDFGIARTGTGPKLTEHGGVVGTIDYVSPEYLERGQVDARSDIYALGVLAYEMVTGEAPYKGKSVIETMTMRLRSDPEPPHHLRPDCPVAISNIILRAMKREPEERYQSAQEIWEDLNELKNAMRAPKEAGGEAGVTGSGSFNEKIDAIREDSYAPGAGGAGGGGVAVSLGASGGGMAAAGGLGAAGRQSVPIAKGEQSGTLELSANTMNRVRESAAEELDDFPVLQSASSGPILDRDRGQSGSGTGPRIEGVGVAVSSNSLSTERIMELSHEMYPPQEQSLGKTVLSWLAIFLIGFGVGLFLLKQFSPDFFGVPQEQVLFEE